MTWSVLGLRIDSQQISSHSLTSGVCLFIRLSILQSVSLLAGVAQIDATGSGGSFYGPVDTLGEYHKAYQKLGPYIVISGFYGPKLNFPL